MAKSALRDIRPFAITTSQSHSASRLPRDPRADLANSARMLSPTWWKDIKPQAPQKPAGQAMSDVLGGMALATAPIPVVGDVAGAVSDAAMYAAYPEERTMLNAGMSLAGLLPFVPGAGGVRAAEKAADALDMSQLDRSTIQSSADQLASQLNNMGFKATVTHSGSKAGPSSYVQISDPQTGRFFLKPVRFSNHGKGPREAQGVISILDLEKDPQDVINVALEMRGKGKSPLFLLQEKEVELQKQGMTWKQARREAERIINQQEER